MKNNRLFWSLFYKQIRRSLSYNPFFYPLFDTYDLIEDLKRSRTSIDIKIEQVNASLKETSTVIKELEEELSLRTEKLKKLQIDYEKYSKLAAVEEDKAAAVIEQVKSTLVLGKSKDRWFSFGLNIVAGLILFVLGLFLSPLITNYFGIGG
ncbi:hypothetical protein [Jeotgalibacillus salarius]|uniref:Uncharacterized protein n=1 Tax=Jeotgalibacillus salarius TaxID=546023 RepID=A0A4Y8LLM4_9BACL|nr:hypothetical protein [Jeotgalibacillus salarius]TFE02873.1 hypothetical protein E2626_03435 [Jeotgalibacillus salarius]